MRSKRLTQKDKLLSHICRYYCNIASASSDKLFYHDCVLDIFKTNHLHKNDYKIYKEYFYAAYGELDIDQLPKALENEEREIKGLFNTFYLLYFEYLKGYVYSCKPSGRVTFDRPNCEKTKAIPYLENAIKGLKNLDDIAAKEVLMESYSCLADIYEALGQNASAAYQHREILSLMSIYWETLKCKSPWSFSAQYSANGKMARFESYAEQLTKAKQYQTIVDYCNTVLDDKRLLEAGDDCYIFVLETLRDAYQHLQKKNEVKRIENLISSHGVEKKNTSSNQEITSDDAIKLYNERQITPAIINQIAHSVSWGWTDYEDFYDLLLEKKDYATIISIGNSVIKECKSQESGGIWLSEEDIAAKRCTRYDYEIDGEREFWHHANGSKAMWHTYYYLALAHLKTGNYEQSIRFQQRVLDNVRTDWKFEPDERERILKQDFSHRNWVIAYPDVEVEMLLQMAYIYLQAKDFNNAFIYYRKALDLNLQILETVMATGSQNVKEEEWDNRNYLYYTILEHLSEEINDYPRFCDLILESTMMQKGFLLNLFLRTKNAVASADLKTHKAYKERNNEEWQIELSCYDQTIDTQSAIIRSQNADIAVNCSIDVANIIRHTSESVSEIRSRLQNDDILVDFFTLYKGQDIEKERQMINDTIGMCRIYYDFHLYANILRKGWQHPKIVYLGKMSDANIGSTEKDLVDYLYYNNNVPTEINTLYKSISFSHFVWNKIFAEGKIQKGENIYFVPTGIFNRIAIESLPMDNNSLVSDYYNIHRLSSIRELHHVESAYSQSDRCVAFGDISYTSRYFEKMTDSQKNAARTMAANPEAILDRSQLACLRSTRSVIETISHVVNNTKTITGTYANEKAFYELSGQSPEILFWGTHGYNFEKQELKEKENTYLFGDRQNVYLSDSEKGMYTSGLYMAPSNAQGIATDGMLTAKEISMQDFSNTKLAILSACSTAIGVSSQDGVYGVQRGFKMAGAISIIASLWDVDATATQILMTEFFKQYTSGVNVHEALRRAQQFVRNYDDDGEDDNTVLRAGTGKIYANPYYWAGFILID